MSTLFDQLLRVRHLEADFLSPKYEECYDPDFLPDLPEAVARIVQAVSRGEKVLIYGDYDVDGVTASTALFDALSLVGMKDIQVMLPNRFTDGYGMSEKIVERAHETGVKLVITVDCGSRNHDIIAELKAAGIDTIVTDHHECGETLPAAVAVVNAKRGDATEVVARQLPEAKNIVQTVQDLRGLAGVGVVFKLAQGLVKAGVLPAGQEKWLLDLVLIGTICDNMVLMGENRRLCYFGMKVLAKTRRPGLKELMRVAGTKQIDSETIGFQIGPRLNAAGRMETAEHALRLLMAKQKVLAVKLARALEDLNSARKRQQLGAIEEIHHRGVGNQPVIVECGQWYEGVLGIIAGRLLEEYHRPAFVLAEVDGCLKGSGRSFGEFNLADALAVCDQYILGGGGHAEACGLRVSSDGLTGFREAVNSYYQSLNLVDQERYFEVQEDLVVEEFEEFSLELMESLRLLEPYGHGNMEPVFLLPEVKVVDVAKMGSDGQHLRLTVWDRNGRSLKLMCFSAPENYLRLMGGDIVNVWINLVENEFRGIRSVEGRILRLVVV